MAVTEEKTNVMRLLEHAGRRGAQVELSAEALAAYLGASFAELTE